MPENDRKQQENLNEKRSENFSGNFNEQGDFMIEKIKERPVNKGKLFRRTLTTAAMAVMFGSIACVTFLILEPVISNRIYPEEEPAPVVFPEDQEEMAPEDMLSEKLPQESEEDNQEGNVSLEQDQIKEILSGLVLNKNHYQQIYSALSVYVAELNHSMVTVTGVSSNIDWFNNVEESKKQSSGVIIANNGRELLVLVDYAPLQAAESLTMTSSFLDAISSKGSPHQIPVVLKSHDPATDLAILAVNLTDVPLEIREEGGLEIASLGSSNSKNIVGSPVVALGSPMGSSGSVGYGMITATGGQNYQADTNYRLLQTDIYGSQKAGGVLFNLQGQVIGVITDERVSSDMKNMVTAYGISELKKSIEKMSNGERIAYLGISGIDVSDEAYEELGVPYGAFVREVEMNSPSMNAGIQQGDVLTSFGERSIRNYNDYITALMQAQGGDAVELTVMRAAQGEYREMKVTVTPDWR